MYEKIKKQWDRLWNSIEEKLEDRTPPTDPVDLTPRTAAGSPLKATGSRGVPVAEANTQRMGREAAREMALRASAGISPSFQGIDKPTGSRGRLSEAQQATAAANAQKSAQQGGRSTFAQFGFDERQSAGIKSLMASLYTKFVDRSMLESLITPLVQKIILGVGGGGNGSVLVNAGAALTWGKSANGLLLDTDGAVLYQALTLRKYDEAGELIDPGDETSDPTEYLSPTWDWIRAHG